MNLYEKDSTSIDSEKYIEMTESIIKSTKPSCSILVESIVGNRKSYVKRVSLVLSTLIAFRPKS